MTLEVSIFRQVFKQTPFSLSQWKAACSHSVQERSHFSVLDVGVSSSSMAATRGGGGVRLPIRPRCEAMSHKAGTQSKKNTLRISLRHCARPLCIMLPSERPETQGRREGRTDMHQHAYLSGLPTRRSFSSNDDDDNHDDDEAT